ncbi:hypothetical protein PBY51_021338 [Eleginops maclovinus]|uniref:Chemokine interleukin-8-like domain-containing protein n=1 Tax=Eleginops maclovinus TaxID=56733 RepID=A0AAN8AKS9_ELEMC|nr:hypothetical protein PBY51_021338 [Eleginops maclovinus]
MTFSLVITALLCFTTWMSTVHATYGPVSSCCRRVTDTKIHRQSIQDYTIQSEGICPITAIAFQTKDGSRICSDPNNGWAKRMIKIVDKKKQKQGSTSSITPAVSATSKKAPQKKCRNGKRRQGKKTKGGKKGQRKRT